MFRLIRKFILTTCVVVGVFYIYEEGKPLLNFNQKATSDERVVNIQSDLMVKDPKSILVLVNKQYTLANDYKPSNLIIPNVPFSSSATEEEHFLRKEAAEALEMLFQSGSDSGYSLIATSGYRSYQTQAKLYEVFVEQMGLEAAEFRAAQPGNSEHQTGLAIDITSSRFNYDQYNHFGETPGGKWVAENAHYFGFIIRYPEGKEQITGYQYEPWHLRYVGVEQATYIFNHNLTFEEYRGAI